MKIKIIDLKYIFIIVGLTLLQERFFFQINRNLVLIISLIGLIYTIFNMKKILKTKFEFKKMIFWLIIIELYGIFISYIKYGQTMFTGIIGTHYIFIYGLYFFFVNLLLKKNINSNIEKFKKIFIFTGIVFSILLIIQSLIYPRIFLKLNYGIRNGLRIIGCNIIQFAFAVSVCDAINNFKLKKIIPIFIMGYELFFINQARNVILIFCVIILFLIYKKNSEKNKLFFITVLLCIPIIIIILNQVGIVDFINQIIFELKNVEGTSGVRVNELRFYYEKLKESKFLGIGILGSEFPLMNKIYGNYKGYYMEDIGISAFIFKTGILGLLWTIAWILKLFSIIKKCTGWGKTLAIFVALKTVFSIFFSISFIFDIKDGLIYFVMILAILDVECRKIEEKEIIKNENSSTWSY